ncbi:nucleotidyl transferase AbiEii/AbiGii toxin family protein [Runella limosa]|uniref:nucleotidyl transferase AbiEii/AbiGii toxin family protein n=1 Tax=Runella limosa TaxID=370978 RepID=UPI00048F1E56|nr:nucleotidyl transferase AbiEii/AbiGii toxin family protein [Runella limosa]
MSYSPISHIFTSLNKHRVQFLVVGGMAVAFYGHSRLSTNMAGEITEKPDIDIWYNPTYENYYALLRAVKELGKDVTSYIEEPNPDPKNSFFKFEFDYYTLDCLPRINVPLKFSESYIRKQVFDGNDLEIPFINLEDLIADKKITGRPKDLSDIEHLL